MDKRQSIEKMAEEVDLQLRAIRQLLQQPVEAEIARGHLTGPQRSVMHVVVHSDGVSLKELSAKVGLAHSTVSGIVDRLEQRELLVRRTDAVDGRVSKIVASKMVRDYLQETLPQLTANPLAEALVRAKPAERAVILEGLRTLRRVMEG